MQIKSIRVDSRAINAKDGQWVGDLPELGDVRVKVRGFNSDYQKLFDQMVRALPPSARKGGIVVAAERNRITGVCLHRHVLLDWDNVEDGPNKVPFSPETALVYLTHPDYEKFRAGVFAAASQVGEEVEEAAAATEKN